MAGLNALVAIREKDLSMAAKAISSGTLSQAQFNIIKQLANAYDKTLAKAIANAGRDTAL